jgi:hypothetical protein
MHPSRRRKLTIAILSLLLAASLAANFALYPRATQPLFSEADRPLIERTRAAARGAGADAGEIEHFFPIVLHYPRRSCVELRSRYGRGHFSACYDPRSGAPLEQQSSVDHPPLGLRERLELMLTGLVGWP